MDIFEAARAGDLEMLKNYLESKPDMGALSEYGYTTLQHAAMGANRPNPELTIAILKLLVEAGSPVNHRGKDGRTALYLLAEFFAPLEAVQYLISVGANPDVTSDYGNHIVVNAGWPEVQAYLSRLTGVPVPPKKEDGPPEVKMSPAAWKKAKKDMDAVFLSLSKAGLIVLQDAGYTQSDGFDDCVEQFHKKANPELVLGFCFYTRQDLLRAKRSSDLPLAIWGAPEGSSEDTEAVGNMVVDAFKNAGFHVLWNGSSRYRPSVFLHKYSEA